MTRCHSIVMTGRMSSCRGNSWSSSWMRSTACDLLQQAIQELPLMTENCNQKRVIYETESDRQRQREAIGHLARATNTQVIETERLVGWDYEMVRDSKVLAMVEVKCRECKSSTYATYMVSQTKALRLRETALTRGVAGGLLVCWKDGEIGWLRIDSTNPEDWLVQQGGRVDRNDPLDIERVVHFDISSFRFINKSEGAFK